MYEGAFFKAYLTPITPNVKKNGQTHFKNRAANTTRSLKCA